MRTSWSVEPILAFITDHHWNPRAGFWAYTKIVDYLEKNNVIPFGDSTLLDISNYNIDTYENWMLGSWGKRTGSYFAGVDDFDVIYPKFETNMSLEIPHSNYSNTGSFKDVVLNLSLLDYKDYFNKDVYPVYGYGDKPRLIYRNEKAPINQKLLVIGDSFTNIPGAFLSIYFQAYEELDMRYFKDDFLQYYDEYSPDIVIILTSVPNNDQVLYDFFPD